MVLPISRAVTLANNLSTLSWTRTNFSREACGTSSMKITKVRTFHFYDIERSLNNNYIDGDQSPCRLQTGRTGGTTFSMFLSRKSKSRLCCKFEKEQEFCQCQIWKIVKGLSIQLSEDSDSDNEPYKAIKVVDSRIDYECRKKESFRRQEVLENIPTLHTKPHVSRAI